METLLSAVRKACPAGLWSQGVSLAKQGAVVVDRRAKDEVTLRVRVPGIAVPPTVNLYVGDGEWSCDCGGKVDPCAHVAACVIALSQRASENAPRDISAKTAPEQAQAGRQEAPASAQPLPGKLCYHFSRDAGTLYLERSVLFADGREKPFAGSLLSGAAAQALPFLPTHEDVLIDRMMSSWKQGIVPPQRLRELLSALETAENIFLDGCPVRTGKESARPRAVIRDSKDGGVIVRIDKDPACSEIVARSLARYGELLKPLSDTALTGEMWEKLPLERKVSHAELGTFVTRILPDLEKSTRLLIRTQRLPQVQRKLRPRVLMQLTQDLHALSVMPLLVYGDPPVARVDGGVLVHLQGAVPKRDEGEERNLIEKLRGELNLVPGKRADFDGEAALRMAQRLKHFRTGGENNESWDEVLGQRALIPRFQIHDERFDVLFELPPDSDDDENQGLRKASAQAVLKAWQDGLDIVPLMGGGFAPLPVDWLSRFGDRVADLIAARDQNEDGKIPPAALPALAKLCDELGAPRPPSFQKLEALLDGFSGIPLAPLPPDLCATLRHYQQLGVNWLKFLKDAGLGGILADDMGLGKTLQALCVLEGRCLVVCPKSVLFNWEAEARKFRPNLRISLYHGPKRALDLEADLILTTYSVLRLDAQILGAQRFECIVLDEAQAIKNPDSQVARAAFGLSGGFKLSLSGTPVENRLEELWSQMHFSNRGLLGGRADFKRRFSEAIEAQRPGAAQALREKIRPFVLRRKKSEVAPELPPKTEQVLFVELDETERQVYDAVRAATKASVVKKLSEGSGVMAALEALLRLRQAACHPALVPGQRATNSSKLEALMEALSDASADGHKSLVFSQWTSFLDLVEPHLREAGIAFNRLDGSTVDRASVVNEFQSENGPSVMLLSLKAGGIGLNLTAADHVFLLDPWWNPAAEDQAADRAHRIGQDKPVFVSRLVAKDSVEERMLALQSKKRMMADAALGEAGGAAAITREDLLALLE